MEIHHTYFNRFPDIPSFRFYLIITFSFFLITFFGSTKSNGQACIFNDAGSIINDNGGTGGNCEFTIDLCIEVSSSSKSKRIDFNLNYDSNGDGMNDQTESYSYAPGGKIPAGTYCLSTLGVFPSPVFMVTGIECSTVFEVTFSAFKNNSGGSGGSCATVTGTISEVSGYVSDAGLPVELVKFKGEAIEDFNLFNWVTASEKNVEYFAIERMGEDKNEFIEIDQINAIGNSTIQQTYSWRDIDPLKQGYYRLQIVDFDGYTEYSNIISIENETVPSFEFDIFPNPVQNDLTIDFNFVGKNASLQIFDMNGKLLTLLDFPEENKMDKDQLVMDMSSFSQGIYIAKISDGVNSKFRKIVKN